MKKNLSLILFIGLNNLINSQCIQNFSAGDWCSFVVKTNGTLYGWGARLQNTGASCACSYYAGSNIPRNIGVETDWELVSVGSSFMVAKKNNGTLWTSTLSCIAGINNAGSSSITLPYQVGTDSDWNKIYTGSHHTLALKTNGTLWSFGLNQFGELGNNVVVGTQSNIPTQVGTDNNWQEIYAGVSHSLSIKTDGTLWAWGLGIYGQLGDLSTTSKNYPVYVGTTNDWANATAGSDCSFAIKTNGTLWAWGKNNVGQLGTGNLLSYNTPVQIGTDNNWLKVISHSNAYYYPSETIALKTDGTIWKRINMNFVQLGTDNNWQNIDLGVAHIIASKTDGTMWTWGQNYSGQLGNGTSYGMTDTPQSINCSTLTIADFENTEIPSLYIYPNPVKNEFYFAGLNEENKFEILNSLGQIIQSGFATNYTQIKTDKLSNGIYYVKINEQIIKLIKD